MGQFVRPSQHLARVGAQLFMPNLVVSTTPATRRAQDKQTCLADILLQKAEDSNRAVKAMEIAFQSASGDVRVGYFEGQLSVVCDAYFGVEPITLSESVRKFEAMHELCLEWELQSGFKRWLREVGEALERGEQQQ